MRQNQNRSVWGSSARRPSTFEQQQAERPRPQVERVVWQAGSPVNVHTEGNLVRGEAVGYCATACVCVAKRCVYAHVV